MKNRRRKAWKVLALSALTASIATGCTSTPGTKASIWPTWKTGEDKASASSGGVTGAFASTTQAVKGQFSTMGTAVSSAYSKTKTAITSPFSAPTGSDSTQSDTSSTALAKTNSLGPEVYVMTGQLHESKGEYAKALDSYSKAFEAEPKNQSALLSMARLYDRQNEKDKAISFYNKAIDVAPNNAASYAELGAVHVKAGNLSAAKDQLQKAVNLDPKSTSYRSSLAGVLLDTNQTDAAMTELTQVYSPAMANYQMAYLHFSRKNVPATQQYLNNALQIDPNLKPARDLLASMGGAQSVQNIAQQGNQFMNQAQGIMQQASAVSSNVQNLWQTPAGSPDLTTSYPSTVPASSAVQPSSAVALPAPPQSAQQPATTINR